MSPSPLVARSRSDGAKRLRPLNLMSWDHTKRALIVVRTYPVPVPLGVESSCTAAITETGEWLRLFPVPWRLLPSDQRFRKYQQVELTIRKAEDDARLESFNLRPDGIR